MKKPPGLTTSHWQSVSAVQVVQSCSCASLSNDRPLSDESWTPDAGGSRKSSYEVRKFVH